MIFVDEKFNIFPKTSKTSFNADSTELTSPDITTEPLNLSIKPKDTFEAFVATSAAIIDASLGVIVSIPIASFLSSTILTSYIYLH
ncbi:hypothetical protein QCK_2022 [Clostridioides difficile CD45]|nr:hypothetical protein QCK_2022 [Clostridioides difficile CD45]